MPPIKAKFYLKNFSTSYDVELKIDPDSSIQIDGQIGSFRYTQSERTVSQIVGSAPVFIQFSDGSSAEIPRGTLPIEALKYLCPASSILTRLESKLSSVFGAVLFSAFALYAIITWVVPATASYISPLVPMVVKEQIGKQTLYMLDKVSLGPSKLPTDAITPLQEALNAFSKNLPGLKNVTLHVRHGGEIGANAFAVPPRYIVFTDELISLLDNDEKVGVLSHELGHLYHDHGTTMLVRTSFTTMASMILFGGDSTVLGAASGLPGVLLETHYSRADESEADEFGVKLLKDNGRDPLALSRALTKLSKGNNELEYLKYISTHPLTKEREDRIKALTGN